MGSFADGERLLSNKLLLETMCNGTYFTLIIRTATNQKGKGVTTKQVQTNGKE